MTEGIGGRIRSIRGAQSQQKFAEDLGVHLKTVQRYEAEKTEVGAAFLQAVCTKFPAINPAWLLTGEGPMRLDAVTAPAVKPAGVDEELMARVAEGIAEVYKAENARICTGPLVRAAARMYDDLVAVYDSPEERQVGLKGMLQQLRRELRSPGAAGANSKQVS